MNVVYRTTMAYELQINLLLLVKLIFIPVMAGHMAGLLT